MIARGRLGLRARAAIGFAATGLVVALLVALATYTMARRYLLEQRTASARTQAYAHARLVRSALRVPNAHIPTLLASVDGTSASSAALRYRGEWYASSIGGADVIPSDLSRIVGDKHAATQLVAAPDGRPALAIGVPIAAVEAEWYEMFPLDDLEHSMDLLARASLLAAGLASIVAGLLGWAGAGRVVRPLGPISDAAARVAGGDLRMRVAIPTDPDLRPLAESFNHMAESLEARIEREVRFTADVTHELRSPLAAVRASVDVLHRRRASLTSDAAAVLEVLGTHVAKLEQTVVDLLELARTDSGQVGLATEPVDLGALLTQLARDQPAEASVEVEAAVPSLIALDRRRIVQAIANIFQNAQAYAGGITAVRLQLSDDRQRARIEIDDRGPGVREDEREAIFGRFARGRAGLEVGGSSGTGLGLALVDEHVRMHGGSVWVEDASSGGARFVIELPLRMAPR